MTTKTSQETKSSDEFVGKVSKDTSSVNTTMMEIAITCETTTMILLRVMLRAAVTFTSSTECLGLRPGTHKTSVKFHKSHPRVALWKVVQIYLASLIKIVA